MSAASIESSASVLRQRALFSATNPPLFVAAQLNAIENVVHMVEKILLLLDLVPNRVHVRVRVLAPEFRLAAVHLTLLHPLTSSTSPALNPAKKPVFEGSFDLFCPKLDESMERKWLRAKNLPKLKDFQETMLKSIQYQMMDSMRPVLHAWNQMRVDDSLFSLCIASSLRLIGSAFANVSKLRRENVIRHVAPSMKPLLKDPRAFSSRECERLFGSKFIDVMVKEVDDDAKLAKIGRDGGPSHSHNGGNSNRRNGGRSQSSYGSRNVQNSGFNKGGKSDKGNHYFKQPAQGANNRYVNLSDCFTPPIFTKTPPVQPHIGGRLSKFSEAWLSLTDDQWILSTVSHGYAIDFVKHPVQHSVPSGCTMSKEMELVCRSQNFDDKRCN
ncbi:hypothetical protein DAPPUDRAFT_338958 [Daphnia pulex]|uniref:Uncharacterized protein n=1 Tax=Daphnia pulex TaxID=6669 RepID=E9I365_DAPPU|nr:hypothetical protein DAPPUDRAFT_338958 [Daphnia pulex]|eukprot:EFX61565.1 hypothetical protein DAPPUDRAFT_338958 [Daphnia pulex]